MGIIVFCGAIHIEQWSTSKEITKTNTFAHREQAITAKCSNFYLSIEGGHRIYVTLQSSMEVFNGSHFCFQFHILFVPQTKQRFNVHTSKYSFCEIYQFDIEFLNVNMQVFMPCTYSCSSSLLRSWCSKTCWWAEWFCNACNNISNFINTWRLKYTINWHFKQFPTFQRKCVFPYLPK